VRREPGGDSVKPAAAAGPAGGGAELGAALAQAVADGVVELGGEGAAPDAGDVGLQNTDHWAQQLRRNAAGGGRGCRQAVRGGDEGVGAPPAVEENALGALEEDRLAGRDVGPDLRAHLLEQRRNPLGGATE